MIPLWEVERLRFALDDWRAILAPRLDMGARYRLVLRHGAVLQGALDGTEVPSREEIARLPEPVTG